MHAATSGLQAGRGRRRGGQAAGRWVALLGVLALLLAACGGENTAAGGGADADGAAATADDAPDHGAGDADAAGDPDGEGDPDADPSADQGGDTASSGPTGTLRMGTATHLQTLDPHAAAVAQEYFLHPVFDTLVHAEPDGSYAPGLAQEYEFVDRHTFRLTLRPDVVFSDGAPLDAAAVVANLERGMAAEASPSAAFFANIDHVEAVDDATVVLHLVEPTTSLLSDLSRLPGMMMSPASFDADPDTNPIGAGGWTYDREASNPGEVEVYRANPDYWAPERVLVETVELRVLDTDAAANAMLGGQTDIIELRTEADRATFDGGGFSLIDRPNANVFYIQIMDTDGTLLEPMGDERVRRALNLAIDREAFNEGIQFGYGDPSPSFWLEGTPYHDPSLEDLAHDPDQARQLLEEAGWGEGFTVTFPTFGELTQVAESVQQMWAEIGVTVEIELVEPGTLAAVMRNGETVMTATLARGFTAESHYEERLAPGSPYDVLGTDRGEIADLAAAAVNAETEEAQHDAWREVYRYATEQGYLMTIGHQLPTAVVADRVTGAVLRPSDNLPQPYGIAVDG